MLYVSDALTAIACSHPHVQGPPLPVQPLHLRRDGDGRVQVRVTGARVRVVERRRDQPVGLDLRDPGRAGAGQGGVRLEVGERPSPGRLMRQLNLPADLLVAERPQRRDRLHRGEHQVHPSDRLPSRLGGPGVEPFQLSAVERVPVLSLAEQLGRDVPAHQVRSGPRSGRAP